MRLSRNIQRQDFDRFQVFFFFFYRDVSGCPQPDRCPPFPTENLENAGRAEETTALAAGQQAPVRRPDTPICPWFSALRDGCDGGLVRGAVLPLRGHSCHGRPPTSRKPTWAPVFVLRSLCFPPGPVRAPLVPLLGTLSCPGRFRPFFSGGFHAASSAVQALVSLGLGSRAALGSASDPGHGGLDRGPTQAKAGLTVGRPVAQGASCRGEAFRVGPGCTARPSPPGAHRARGLSDAHVCPGRCAAASVTRSRGHIRHTR